MLTVENELESRFVEYRQFVNDLLVHVSVEYDELSEYFQKELSRLSSSIDGATLVQDSDGRTICSKCAEELSDCDDLDVSMNYCPACGTKMSDAIMKDDAVWKSQLEVL